MGKRWRIHPFDSQLIANLERAAGVSPVVAQMLLIRGITAPERVREFLDVKLSALRDPELLGGVSRAADLLHEAIRDQKRIIVYGDYDADGITATSLLLQCLKLLGANVTYYLPDRISEGYGLNDDALRTLAARGANVVVTVDCGIGSLKEAETARELGLTLIVTDHHQMGSSLPNAAAIVHPMLPEQPYPFAGLCGAGVAFKLAWAICQQASQAKRVTDAMRDFLMSAIGLAAIGTVADMVPVVDENRILVKHGLVSLKERPSLGLAALMKVTKLDQKSSLSSEDIGFSIGPRLNAAGRLGQAKLAVELLTTDSPKRAQELADYIHELNGSRESLERSIYLSANKQVTEHCDAENDAALVLSARGWHPGVIGIVAGRLAEKFHRPVVMVALDDLGSPIGTGSARTAGGINLHAALTHCAEHLVGYGGHAAAAGLRIDESHIPRFREEFCEFVSTARVGSSTVIDLDIDGEAPLGQLTLNAVKQMEQLAPFGQGNPRPVLCATAAELAEPPKKIGAGERHLSLKVKHHGVQMRGVAFGHGDWADELAQVKGAIDLAYRPTINEFRGRQSVEFHLVDWRPTQLGSG